MNPNLLRGRVLSIAGSDSGGGAGIQADIKAITALGCFAMTAVTAITVQNTQGVTGIHGVPENIIEAQIGSVLSDLGADCIKTGMLGTQSVIDVVAAALSTNAKAIPLVVDPVMVAKGGAPLLAENAVEAMRSRLLPRATLITPNLPEAEVLTGRSIRTATDMKDALKALQDLGARAILLKGGHLPGNDIIDMFRGPGGEHEWRAPRIQTRHTHGTGCTLASSIAAGLAQGMDIIRAISRARDYVRVAIETAPGFGQGHGPLNHSHTVRVFEGG
jgi:hydroxymethylpyrimidine/phosphomethylpyrimidine kinase